MASSAAVTGDRRALFDRPTMVWIILCALTIASFMLSPTTSTDGSLAVVVVVVALTAVKCRLVFGTFMEGRTAPVWLRLAFDAWLLAMWSAIVVAFVV